MEKEYIYLEDVSSRGKRKPWTKRKLQSHEIAASLERIGEENKAENMRNCGQFLKFNECPSGHYKKLTWANFCRIRLCPLCSWRRSLRAASNIKAVTHEANKTGEYKWLFLTLTVRNVEGEKLSNMLFHLFQSWQRFSQRRSFRNAVEGWFRGLEVTVNEDEETYHPHFHILLAVKKSYFTDPNIYLEQKEWAKLWRESLRVDYVPVVDIRAIRPTRNIKSEKQLINQQERELAAAIVEVAKYPTKPDSYITEDRNKMDTVIFYLNRDLAGRKLLGYGGILKTIWKKLRLIDIEEDDSLFETPDNCNCPTCGSDLLEHLYKWRLGANEYIRKNN